MKNLILWIALILVVPAVCAQNSPEQNEKFKAAKQAYQAKKFEDAKRGFEQANKELGGKCVWCLLNAASASSQLVQRGEVLKFSAKAVEVASTPQEKFSAYSERSRLLLTVGPSDKELAEAEEYARKAIELKSDSLSAHTALAMALLRESKDEAGVAELKWLDSRVSSGDEKKRIEAMIADPRRARLAFAPEFTAMTANGKQITLADFKGKAVLIDFWATWCPPCRASVPEIKELRKKYGADHLVVLSVSGDNNKQAWSEYIAKHEMSWMQSLDRDNQTSVFKAFEVHSFPTYVLLDGDGIVRERINGLELQQSLTSRLRGALDQLFK